MRRRRFLAVLSACTAITTPALARLLRGGGGPGIPPSQSIQSVSPTGGNVPSGSASGTVIGACVAVMSPTSPAFAGTFSVTAGGTTAQVSNSGNPPCNLETLGTLADGTYSGTLTATQTGAGNSPFHQNFSFSVGAVQLATLKLVNTSGSTQASGAISPMFGWAFKKGDVPSGTAPQFLVSGTPQPYSWGCQVYWSDGSLKFASFMLRTTTSIAGSGSLSVGVWNRGTAPSASSRTLTEVYNQLVQVNITGQGSNFGLSGTWNAVLASNGNNLEQYVYLDGAAGKVWRILTDFVQSGSAHGQLECYHYIAALTDASGNLGGFRYNPRITQPWYNHDTPAKATRLLSGPPTWQHGSGPTTANFVWPFNTYNFNWTSGPTFNTTTANNLSSGTSSEPVVPVYFTTTGTLPAPLSASTLYYAQPDPSGTDFLILFTANGAQSGFAVVGTDNGSGTHTLHPVPAVLHFGSLFGATTNATWNFFQGTGSLSADSTIRTQIDQTYWQSTRVIAPYDLSLLGSVNDNATPDDWNQQAVGPLTSFQGQTGERDDIAPMNGWAVRHFYNQSAVSEKTTRIIGYATSNEASSFREVTTRQFANLSNSSYTGMPSSGATTLLWNSSPSQTAGFTAPPEGCNVFTTNGGSHRPEMAFWSYLFTGEPQFLDLLLEMGNISVLSIPNNGRNPTMPTSQYGLTTAYNGTQGDWRELGWDSRDLQLAAGLAPATMPDGSAVNTYLNDLATASMAWINTICTSSNMNAYAATNGMFLCTVPGKTSKIASSWQRGYFISAICFGAGLREDTGALSALANIFAVWYSHSLSAFGGYTLYGYYETNATSLIDSNDGWPLITSDAEWGVSVDATTFSWTTSNPAFTIIPATAGGANWVLTNGDKFIWTAGQDSNFSAFTPYYARDVSGNTCNLAASIGGTAIIPSGSGSTGPTTTFWVPFNPPTTGIPSAGGNGSSGYLANVHAVSCWGKALLGTSAFDAVVSDGATRLAAQGTSFTAFPKYAMQTSF